MARITHANALVFREVRLRALREAPLAFGSTYARESGFTDEDWAVRIERWNGERGVGFVAMEGETACGLAGALLDDQDEGRAELVSMWTSPEVRGCGVGRLLVQETLGWAAGRGVKDMYLMVTSNNDAAIGFYERLGFVRTGKVLAYPNDAALMEWEMHLSIAAGLGGSC